MWHSLLNVSAIIKVLIMQADSKQTSQTTRNCIYVNLYCSMDEINNELNVVVTFKHQAGTICQKSARRGKMYQVWMQGNFAISCSVFLKQNLTVLPLFVLRMLLSNCYSILAEFILWAGFKTVQSTQFLVCPPSKTTPFTTSILRLMNNELNMVATFKHPAGAMC